MRNIIKNLIVKAAIILGVIMPGFMMSQVGVGPAPYCMPLYFNQPCNSPFPSNTPGNGVNDFIHSYNTAGATFNIVNNASGCNAQNLSGTKNYRFWGCQFYMITSPGQVITSNFQSGNVFAQGNTVFVDWNQDGVFNPAAFTGVVPGGERVTSTAGVPPAAVMTPMPAWTVPNVPAGVYRMRVRCAYATAGPFIQPCNTYGYGETEEYNVYVNTTPNTMTVTLTSNSPVCIGNQININTQVTLAPGAGTCVAAIPNFTYSWTGPMSFTSNVMNPSFTATNVLQSGVYTLNISPGTCGCNSTNTIQIWVNPNPSTSITNNGPVCQGSALNFTNNVNGSGNMTYNWTGPNGFTANTPQISFASAQTTNTGVYNFTVVSTFTNNGGSCMATSSSSAAVVPVAQVSVTPSFTQCQGTNVNLVGNINGATSILWNGPNGYTSNVQNPVLANATPSISGNYSITASFTAQTTTLVCSSSAVSNVSIVPMNPVSVWATYNVCQGSTASFSASAASNPSYSWVGPNGYSSSNQVNSINNILPSSSGNYTVNAIWSIGTVSCITSNFTSISVVPVSSISVIPQITICNGESTAFTASANGAVSYTWNGPNSFSVTQPNTQFQNLTPSWSGQYTVTALFTNGNLNCYSSNTTDLLVKPNIQFSITPINRLCFGQTLNVNGPNGATSYTWNGPGFTSNTQNLYLPNASTINIGTYTLTVDLNGCKTYGSVFVDVQDPIKWKNAPDNITLCKGDSFTVTAQADGGSGNYAYNWNPYYNITGPTGSVQAGIAQGTTFYNVSVYDIACPQYTINHSFVINVNMAPTPDLKLNTWKGCEPLCQVYDGNIKNATSITYSFADNSIYSGDSLNICLSHGEYTLNITTIGVNGCKETFKQGVVEVYPRPNADFSWDPSNPNSISESYVTFIPSNQIMPISSYMWDFHGVSQSTDKTPTYQFEKQDNYLVTLIMVSNHDCKDTVSKIVQVRDEFQIYIPNAFTPNGDGLNDTFNPKGTGIKTYELSIFDRWGSEIFRSTDMTKPWDGTFKGILVQDGTYVYKIIITDNKGMRHTKTGHVIIMK